MERKTARLINEEVKRAIQPIAGKYGLTIEPTSATFSSNGISIKIKLGQESSLGNIASKEDETNFKLFAEGYNLKPEWYGTEFKNGEGEVYIITGLKPRRRKYPVSATRKRDGEKFKFGAKTVKLWKETTK